MSSYLTFSLMFHNFVFFCCCLHTRPCKIQCTFDCHRVGKTIAPFFVYVWPPPLGSKWPQQTQLLDGVGGTLFKSCKCSWIFLKTYFFGKCLFSPWNVQCDKFWTSLTHLYCPCGDFHQKIFSKHVQFLKIPKILIMIILKMLEKVCNLNFF